MKCRLDLALTVALTISSATLSSLSSAASIAVPGDHKTIQSAVDFASPGDTIIVGPGNYLENVVLIDKTDLTLIGEEGAENTIIDGDQKSAAVSINSCGGTTTLIGFTFTRGLSDANGGGLAAEASNLALRWCWFTDNEASNEGGGVALINCTEFSVLNCQFRGNRSQAAAGLTIVGGRGEVKSNLFSGNDGGLTIAFSFSRCRFEGNTVVRNLCTGFGPVGYLVGLGGEIIGNTISHNSGTAGSGAITAQTGEIRIERNIISDNSDVFAFLIDSKDNMISVEGNLVWKNDAGVTTGNGYVPPQIEADPLFCNAKKDNYQLKAGSPCLANDEHGLIGAQPAGCR